MADREEFLVGDRVVLRAPHPYKGEAGVIVVRHGEFFNGFAVHLDRYDYPVGAESYHMRKEDLAGVPGV